MSLSRACFLAVVFIGPAVSLGLPRPKEGVLIPRSQADEIRARVLAMEKAAPAMNPARPNRDDSLGILKLRAARALADWPAVKAAVEPHAGKMLDLNFEPQANPEPMVGQPTRDAARQLMGMVHCAPSLAFMYFLEGEQKHADTCFEIIEMAGRVPRWGWFNWAGANMPQIHYGQITRSVALAIDLAWDGWDPARRKKAIEILGEKGVESYWRLVNHTPFMSLTHLRSKNQGNNAVSAAIIASMVIGDSLPENRDWSASLILDFSWLITSDIGWAGQNLESGMPGYWSISMHNLYCAATAIANVRGIDFRPHPGFAEATYYPIFHETTVPPVDHFNKPIAGASAGAHSTIAGKPVELPHQGYCGSWWYDYAQRFPGSPAGYFIAQSWGKAANCHQEGHHELYKLLWTDLASWPENAEPPSALFKATDRMAMFRSGYGSPHSYLYFNGDMFLSARNEILCVTSGMSWHFPWHQYAVSESVLETEGEPFSPSMVIHESAGGDWVSSIRSHSGPSNITYYPRAGQLVAHQAYELRDRDIYHVRSADPKAGGVGDYFLFIDRVRQKAPRWHAFNWHLWNKPGNEGSYEIIAPNQAIGHRPNADVLLATLSHEKMTYELQGVVSQPCVSYAMDHNGLLLRAIAGAAAPPADRPAAIPARGWSDGEMEGEARVFTGFKDKKPKLARAALKLVPGQRYKVTIRTKKQNARIYENFAWVMDLTLLDAGGNVVARPQTPPRDPDPLRLTDPASNEKEYDWRETGTYFDAPANVEAVEAAVLPATYGHDTTLKPDSKLWLGELVFTPLGAPQRDGSAMLATVAIPLDKGAKRPAISSRRDGAGVRAEVAHPDGTKDAIAIDEGGAIRITRSAAGGAARQYATPPAQGNASKRNAPGNAQLLKRGLAKLTDECIRQRDQYTSRGWKNIALEATATASGTRDERFAASHVIDNQTWEFPADGVLDYTLGEIQTTPGTGYGRERNGYTQNMTSWPMFIPPTYWLLPYREKGEVTLKLKDPAKLKLVRVLNTCNAGLADYAAVEFSVELLREDKTVAWSKAACFGEAHDRAFAAAFAMPGHFSSYGLSFEELLKPGVKVPFPPKWQEIEVACDESVRYVRVNVIGFWALGGGINEIQVYPREE